MYVCVYVCMYVWLYVCMCVEVDDVLTSLSFSMHACPFKTPSAEIMPPGWQKAFTSDGLTYYIDHTSRTTHWSLPSDDLSSDSACIGVMGRYIYICVCVCY